MYHFGFLKSEFCLHTSFSHASEFYHTCLCHLVYTIVYYISLKNVQVCITFIIHHQLMQIKCKSLLAQHYYWMNVLFWLFISETSACTCFFSFEFYYTFPSHLVYVSNRQFYCIKVAYELAGAPFNCQLISYSRT